MDLLNIYDYEKAAAEKMPSAFHEYYAGGVAPGRTPLWGLAVNGETGVQHVLKILQSELVNVMAQCGGATIADLTPDLIFAA